MIANTLDREAIIDLTRETLGAGWLRRNETRPQHHERLSENVWRTGPQLHFRDALVDAMNNAQEVLLLSSFLLADDAIANGLIQAAERGVRTYVITASEQRLDKFLEEDESFEHKMVEQHKTLLAKLAGKVLLRSGEHIHAKFLIVDPQLDHEAQGWLSTANFNKALENSIELGIRLPPFSARALAECFNWAFWQEAQRELRGPKRLVEIQSRPSLAPKRPSAPQVFATLNDGTDLRGQVLKMIRSADREILAASYGLDPEHVVLHELALAAQRGVQVSLLTRPRPAVAQGTAALAAAGVRILAHDKLHAKALVVDGHALVMTANFDTFGLDTGFEVGAILEPEAAQDVEHTLREWIDNFPWEYRADAVRGDHLGDFCPADKGLRDGVIRIVANHRQQAANIEAPNALDLEGAPPPRLSPIPVPQELPQQVHFNWQVRAPRLPDGATELFQESASEPPSSTGRPRPKVPFDPPVYQHKKLKYVVPRTLAQADRASQLAEQLGARLVLKPA